MIVITSAPVGWGLMAAMLGQRRAGSWPSMGGLPAAGGGRRRQFDGCFDRRNLARLACITLAYERSTSTTRSCTARPSSVGCRWSTSCPTRPAR